MLTIGDFNSSDFFLGQPVQNLVSCVDYSDYGAVHLLPFKSVFIKTQHNRKKHMALYHMRHLNDK